MLRVTGGRAKTCGGWSRRDLLAAGGLGLLGAAVSPALAAEAGRTFGRAKAFILVDLYGGPAHQEIVQLLVDAGADPGIADRDGVTALQHARERGYDEIARTLEAAGGATVA